MPRPALLSRPRHWGGLVLGLGLVTGTPLRAQSSGPGSAQAPSARAAPAGADTLRSVRPDSGLVIYRTDTLFTLYGRLGPFGPEERARAAGERITQRARAIQTGSDSVRVARAGDHYELLVGDAILMTVLDADAAPTGDSTAALAARFADRITRTLEAERAASGFRVIVTEVGLALAVTAGFVLLLMLLGWVFRRAYGLIETAPLPALRIQRLEVLSATALRVGVRSLARAARWILTIILVYLYVPTVLSIFPPTAPYSRRIMGYIMTPIRSVGEAMLGYLPKIFFIAVIVVVTRFLLRFIRMIFDALGSGTLTMRGFHRDWAQPTYNLVRFLVLVFAAVAMFPYLPGSGSDAFKGISIFVGVILSLGSSGAVSNIMSGIVLVYTRAFQPGDRVTIAGSTGDVLERTLLVTRVRTIKNEEITIPNGQVLGSHITNFTVMAAKSGLILHTTVTIGYDVPWRRVHEMLIAAARATPEILADPAPFVLQTSLDDFYVSYQLNAFTARPDTMAATYSALHQNIQDEFFRSGVEIMSPHYRALRDGNTAAIPADQLGADYQAPRFRVATRTEED